MFFAVVLLSAALGHGSAKRPKRKLSDNNPATSVLQRDQHGRKFEAEFFDMKPTTSIRSATNVSSLGVFVHRD